jgi:DNA-nicking Smr family endonuclease
VQAERPHSHLTNGNPSAIQARRNSTLGVCRLQCRAAFSGSEDGSGSETTLAEASRTDHVRHARSGAVGGMHRTRSPATGGRVNWNGQKFGGFTVMSGGDDIPPEDRELFRSAIGQLRKLEHDRVEQAPKRPRPVARSRMKDEAQVLQDMVSDEFHPANFETGEDLSYLKPGIQQSLLRKLRRGQFSVSGELDLHGMTVPVAKPRLMAFLSEMRRDGLNCVRVIHGKGLRSSNRGPVLKHKLNVWLRQRDDVLAFCSARPVDGGTGAVYVLLKRWSP